VISFAFGEQAETTRVSLDKRLAGGLSPVSKSFAPVFRPSKCRMAACPAMMTRDRKDPATRQCHKASNLIF
jgi:hypothetical protein